VIAIVTAAGAGEADGIRDYSERLLAQLREGDGVGVRLVELEPDDIGRGHLRVLSSGLANGALSDAEICVIQYEPFSFGRWGFAPSLIADVARARLSRKRPLIALLVHETYLPAGRNWRWALMSVWQRLQLIALRAATDVQLCSIEAWARRLRRMPPWTPVHHLPVGSNLPDARHRRAEQRAALGVGSETTVLACFGLRHPGRLPGHVMAAAEAIARTGRPVRLLDLGTGEPRRERRGAVTVDAPGFLEAGELAGMVAAADIFLAPYADGVSTRRTTVMAALQHGLPVVGTTGPLTDRVLREATDALELAPVGDLAAFVERARDLADDDGRRAALGGAGRALYESRFDWPIVSRGLLRVLRGST
jgi:glycosyltransferase involved in cell wall biosynthesis